MTIFELVKIALDELYEQGQAEYGGVLDDKIREKMGYLSDSYSNLNSNSRAPVDYRDPATRFAYVYKYVAAHGDYVVQLLQKLHHAREKSIFANETARITCVGGGPGSDIIAVIKFLDAFVLREPVRKVTCYLLDKEQAWADTWTEIDDKLGSSIALNVNFQPLDVTIPASWEFQKKFLQADLFTLSYFVSEVRSLDGDGVVTNFWRKLFEGAKPGAFFLYDDNGHQTFNEYFDNLCNGAALRCLLKETNVKFTPQWQERASELDFYKSKFGQMPKLSGYITYRVLQKE